MLPYRAGEPLTVSQIRELDVLTIEHVGVPGLVLMENAGRAAAELAYGALVNPSRDRVLILCGPGQNGGDGLVAARCLHNAGANVRVVLAAAPARYEADAATNLRIVQRMSIEWIPAFEPAGLERALSVMEHAEVVVDALLGTGAKGAPRGVVADLIRASNQAARARRIAIDIPSGLCGDTGAVHDPCFQADLTVTFVAEKTGFVAPSARSVLGRVVVADVGVPRELIPGRTSRGLTC